MKIQILGTRGEIDESLPYHSKHSGVLIDDELLLDVGEKSFLNLNPYWILITHFHPDHAYFVRRGSEENPPDHIPLFAPETNNQANIEILDKPKRIGPYSVTPIPTHHSKHLKSQAYVIKKDRHSIFYTGDLVWIDKKYHSEIGTVDLIITEGSFLRKGGMVRKDPENGKLFGHNGIPNLLTLLKPFSKKIVFMHFGAWFYKNTKESKKKLIELGKEYGMEVIVGYDGLIINVS